MILNAMIGAPELMLILVAGGIILSTVIFSIWGYKEGKKREIGATAGFLLGFFISWIGIIIVYISPKNDRKQLFDIPSQLKRYKDLLDSGAISEDEYVKQKARLLQ